MAAIFLVVAGVPAAAFASVSTYANYAHAIEDQVFVSPTGTIGGNQGYVSGTLPTEWLTIRKTSSGALVAEVSGAGGTTVSVFTAPTSGLHDACWWNYGTVINGYLLELCKSSTTEGFAVSQASSIANTSESSSPNPAGASSQGTQLPAAAASELAAQGFDVSAARYLGDVDSGSAWSMTNSENEQCVVETLSNGIAGADCASVSFFDATGLSLELGTTTQAPSKLYLLPPTAQANATQAGTTLRSTSSVGVFVTVAPGDNAAHTFTSASGKTFSLHQFGDWATNANHVTQ
jgi:hypothetical protein